MHPEVTLAVRLQEIDLRIGELEREVAALPKHIGAIEKTLDQHLRKLEADRAALSANQKDRKRFEGEVQTQEQKISKLKDQMLAAKTNEQYRAFQHEIEYCQNEIRKAEDRILELMAESEALEQNVRAAEIALNTEKEQVEAEKESARRRTAADEAQLKKLRAEREASFKGLSRAVAASYQKLRQRRAGIAVAEVTEGRCNACNIVLRPQFFQDLRTHDTVMYCESCGRILCYNPPVAVEESGARTYSGPPAASGGPA